MSALPTGGGLIPAQLRLPLLAEAKRVVKAVDVHAISNPAKSFTGDFYVAHRGSDRLWLAIGDVAGKGLPAAVVMAMIQEELERRITSCASTACDPAATLQRLHEFLRPLTERNRFATAAIAQLHDDGTLVVANGGHCPPLIARRNGSVQSLGSTGPVLGLLPGGQWSSVSLRLEHGDSMLLYTDGVIEAEANGQEFGGDRLKRAFASAAFAPEATSRHIAGRIAAAVREHANGSSHDDLTLVVVRR